MDDHKEEREGESGGEQAAGGCEGQQVTFLPTVRLAAFGHLGAGSNPAKCSPYVQDGQEERSSYQQFSLGCPYRNNRLQSQ